MNCENWRQRLAEDPARTDPEFDRHAADCAACAAYRARLLRAETLIHQALRFDIGAVQAGPGAVEGARGRGWVSWLSGAAAGLLVGVTLWGLFGSGAYLPPEALATEVTQHWYHEPDAWRPSTVGVADAVLTDVLDGEAVLDLAALATVSYAKTCWVAGRWIPHLVVQGPAGPYMVLLMPGRDLASPVPLELPEEGLSGRIVPAGGGSIAVLGGGRADELARMESSIIAALDWTT